MCHRKGDYESLSYLNVETQRGVWKNEKSQTSDAVLNMSLYVIKSLGTDACMRIYYFVMIGSPI